MWSFFLWSGYIIPESFGLRSFELSKLRVSDNGLSNIYPRQVADAVTGTLSIAKRDELSWSSEIKSSLLFLFLVTTREVLKSITGLHCMSPPHLNLYSVTFEKFLSLKYKGSISFLLSLSSFLALRLLLDLESTFSQVSSSNSNSLFTTLVFSKSSRRWSYLLLIIDRFVLNALVFGLVWDISLCFARLF